MLQVLEKEADGGDWVNVGSLFSGVGGIELGFEREGFRTIWFVECDPYAQAVLRNHWPDATIYDDVTSLDFGAVQRPDVLTGGFPCQDISNAGKRAGITGSRSSLWKYYLKAIRELRPKYAVIENVAALADRGLNVVLADLAEVGYDAEWYNLSASAVGAPHRRERIFIIAYPKESGQLREEQLENDCCSKRRDDKGEKCSAVDVDEEGKIRCQDANLADSELCGCVHGQAQEFSTEGRLDAQREPLTSSADVADSESIGMEVRCERFRPICQPTSNSQYGGVGNKAKSDSRRITNNWSVEPDVGRVVARLPAALDKVVMQYAKNNCEETKSKVDAFNREVLRIMWQHREAAKTSFGLFCPWDIPDIVPDLPQELTPSIRDVGQRIEEDEELCCMWQTICASPFDETPDLQQGLLERIRKAQCNETLDCIERVNRIKCLGNAVVPQVAQVIAQAIREYEAGLV